MLFSKHITKTAKTKKAYCSELKSDLRSKSETMTKTLLLASAISFAPLVHAEETAIDLLNRMNQALHQLNYNGTLAYLRGNSLSTLQIDHKVVNGVVAEKVVRLNESGREVSREEAGFSLTSIPRIHPEMEKVYSFDIGRQNRVANIPCTIITVRPKDRERYLQKYCIDKQTGMLLDFMLVGKSHKPVEQFMFTTIEISMPEAMVAKSDCQTANLNCSTLATNADSANAILNQAIAPLIENQITQPRLRKIPDTTLNDGWMITVPPGYDIRQAPHMKNEKEGGEVHHYIVSDGLSTISVFVSSSSDLNISDAIKVNSGALNVVSQAKGDHRITVVGEAPETTLKNLVKNLRKGNP